MIQYEVQGKIGVVTGSSKQEVTLQIPASLDNYPIAKIEGSTFQEQSKLKKVIIPGSVKVIGGYSFAGCPNLKEVVLEEGVEVIEDWAFVNCNIEHITLPSSIKTVGNNAFLGNMCKYDVEEYFKKKDEGKKSRARSNNRAAVFPLSLMEAKENINNEIIESRSRYVDSQFELIDQGSMTQEELDIPIQFNNDECMVAYYSKNNIRGALSFEVASESKTQLGLYGENDPDWLVLKINVIGDGKILSNFFMKIPYAEEVKIQNNGTEKIDTADYHYYFTPVKVKMKCYGNGNINREFALNQFTDFMGKYDTELRNGLIRQEQYDDVKDTVDAKIMEVMDGFLGQIDGAPMFTYVNTLFRYTSEDPDIERREEISEYKFKLTLKYYNELSSVESLEKICFQDVYESLEFLTTITGMTRQQMEEKYGITLMDASGLTITDEDAKTYQNIFMDLETNYNLHADFLVYIYKEMQRLNNSFSVQAFSA
ncbi:MAG: leucine-rich repeat domain-containing protein [Acholeplasmatales bacterium]|nr:leucine-rich repeat domain-containing protein [Acholeplasmatales bacterium]